MKARRKKISTLILSAAIGLTWLAPGPATGAPRPAIDYKQNDFQVVLTESGESAKLRLRLGNAGRVRSSFTVDSPGRFVIDVSGVKLGQNRVLKPTVTGMVTAVRIGVHDDIIRIVVDCRGDDPPQFSVEGGESGDVVISLSLPAAQSSSSEKAASSSEESSSEESSSSSSSSESALAESSSEEQSSAEESESSVSSETAQPTIAPTVQETATPKPTKTAGPTKTPAPTRTPRATSTPKPTATPRPTKTPRPTSTPLSPTPTTAPAQTPLPTPTAAVTVAIPVVSDKPSVTGIQFDYTGAERSPTIKISLSARSDFRMTKADDRSFDLQISGYELANPQVALPQFPPDDFIGFTYVRVIAEAGTVHIVVGVDRGVRISSVNHDNEIWIKTQS